MISLLDRLPDKREVTEMVNQTKHNQKHNETKSLTPPNEGFSQLLSNRKSKDNFSNDDLVGSLAEAYENKRAQQVAEWDRLGRQNLYQTLQRAA